MTLTRSRHRDRDWRAFPDPASCSHFYICRVTQQTPLPARHACTPGTLFNRRTETCRADTTCQQEKRSQEQEQEREVRSREEPDTDTDKQSLFVEFIQFLIKIGMFNKKIVNSMLVNKEIFL